MTRDEQLREIQRRIAEAKGWTALIYGPEGAVTHGTPPDADAAFIVPRWPWDWCDAGVLVEEMAAACKPGPNRPIQWVMGSTAVSGRVYFDLRPAGYGSGEGTDAPEAIARCWCAWRGIDLSDLT